MNVLLLQTRFAMWVGNLLKILIHILYTPLWHTVRLLIALCNFKLFLVLILCISILFFPPWYAEPFYFFRRKEVKWVHEINLERKDFGESHTLVPELRQDDKRYYIYFRMPSEFRRNFKSYQRRQFKKVHKLSWSYISRRTTCYNTKVTNSIFLI